MHFLHCRTCGASMSGSDASMVREAAKEHARACGAGPRGIALSEWPQMARALSLRRAR